MNRPALSIDIGGTRTKIAVVEGGVVHRETFHEMPTPGRDDPEAFVAALAECARPHLREPGRRLAGIGVAVPGFLDSCLGAVVYCPNTPALAGYPLRRALACATGVPVAVEVDCNAAALAEYRFGNGKHARRLLVISLGTGVGCGVLVDGKPVRIAGGCCGDMGHVYVGGTERCSSGCKGCLESAISVEALVRETSADAVDRGAAVRRLIESAVCGDERSRAVLRRAGIALGVAIASWSSFVQPDLVLLAGGISEAGDLIAAPAAEAMREYAAPYFSVPIRKGSFGSTAALAGAAASLFDQMEYLP